MLLYVHRDHKDYQGHRARMATSPFTLLLSSPKEICHHIFFFFKLGHKKDCTILVYSIFAHAEGTDDVLVGELMRSEDAVQEEVTGVPVGGHQRLSGVGGLQQQLSPLSGWSTPGRQERLEC